MKRLIDHLFLAAAATTGGLVTLYWIVGRLIQATVDALTLPLIVLP